MVYENGVHQVCVVFSLHIRIDKIQFLLLFAFFLAKRRTILWKNSAFEYSRFPLFFFLLFFSFLFPFYFRKFEVILSGSLKKAKLNCSVFQLSRSFAGYYFSIFSPTFNVASSKKSPCHILTDIFWVIMVGFYHFGDSCS
mgnify:CR=1 FL=1